MKNLKKFAALLLVGAMALLMLTPVAAVARLVKEFLKQKAISLVRMQPVARQAISKKIIRACRLLLMDICRRI